MIEYVSQGSHSDIRILSDEAGSVVGTFVWLIDEHEKKKETRPRGMFVWTGRMWC